MSTPRTKPVRPTDVCVRERVEKNKTQNKHFDKAVPAGDLNKLMQVAHEFAAKNGCDPSTIRFVRGWAGTRIRVSRTETPEEKFRRVKQKLMDSYWKRKASWDAAHPPTLSISGGQILAGGKFIVSTGVGPNTFNWSAAPALGSHMCPSCGVIH